MHHFVLMAEAHALHQVLVVQGAAHGAASLSVNPSDDVLSTCRRTVVQWQEALKLVPGLKAIDSLQPEKSAVAEELNLVWARHELISDKVDEVRSCSCPGLLLLPI